MMPEFLISILLYIWLRFTHFPPLVNFKNLKPPSRPMCILYIPSTCSFVCSYIAESLTVWKIANLDHADLKWCWPDYTRHYQTNLDNSHFETTTQDYFHLFLGFKTRTRNRNLFPKVEREWEFSLVSSICWNIGLIKKVMDLIRYMISATLNGNKLGLKLLQNWCRMLCNGSY